MSLGKNIKDIRSNKGLTQEELAIKSGLSRNAIYNYENEKRSPDLNTLTNIADSLDVTVNDLIGASPIEVESSKTKPNNLKGIKIDVSIQGYDKAKQQLRNLEATYDRILEKQKLIDKGNKQMYDADEWKRTMADGRWVKDHELLQRIDTDCGRIVRVLELNKPKTINITIDGKTASAITDDYNKSYNEYCKKYCNR